LQKRSPDEITSKDRQALKSIEKFFFGDKSPQEVSKQERNAVIEEVMQDAMFR